MKFRCKISNDGVKLLLSMVLTLMKIYDRAIIILSDDYLRIVVVSDQLIEQPRIYVELSSQLLCSEYRIESQHDQNSIIFEMNLSVFAKALSSGKFSTHSIFKLTKKEERPYFTMECKAAESLLSMDLVHDLPIQLIRVYDFASYAPPTVSKPLIAFDIPRTRTFKILLDRLSKMNKVVYLIAQYYSSSISTDINSEHSPKDNNLPGKYGQLKLQVDNQDVKIQSFLNNLLISSKLEDSPPLTHPVVISVYSKKLSQILDYHNIAYHESTLFMTPNEALILHLDLSPVGLGSISYYLPVLVNEESLVAETDQNNKEKSSSSLRKKKQSTHSSSSSSTAVVAEVEKKSSGKGPLYDTINIEYIKRIVERETIASRQNRGNRNAKLDDPNAADFEEEEEESDDDGLWRDNSLLTSQYAKDLGGSKETRRKSNIVAGDSEDEDEDYDAL